MSSAPWRAAADGARGPGVFGGLQRPFKGIRLPRDRLPTLLSPRETEVSQVKGPKATAGLRWNPVSPRLLRGHPSPAPLRRCLRDAIATKGSFLAWLTA